MSNNEELATRSEHFRVLQEVGSRGRRARVHELKTWPEPFERLWAGDKRHEVRKDDRGYAVGDLLILREYDPAPGDVLDELHMRLCGVVTEPGRYTDRAALVVVSYITPGGRFGLAPDICVMSVHVIEQVERYEGGIFNQNIVAYGGVL